MQITILIAHFFVVYVRGPNLFILDRIMSTKAAATDPMWNPSIAGRELLKPKFYDVWLHVSGKNQAMVLTTKTKTSSVVNVFPGELLKNKPSSARALGKDGLLYDKEQNLIF